MSRGMERRLIPNIVAKALWLQIPPSVARRMMGRFIVLPRKHRA